MINETVSDLFLEKMKLAQECGSGTQLSSNFRLYPGWKLVEGDGEKRFEYRIAGTFGMLYTLPTELGLFDIAQCGFDVRGRIAIITNSPQGFKLRFLEEYPNHIKNAALMILREGNYRQRLIQEVIDLCQQRFAQHGVKVLIAPSAAYHPKVIEGALPTLSTIESVDQIYEQKGFKTTETGDYFLFLQPQTKLGRVVPAFNS